MMTWLSQNPSVLERVIKPEDLESQFGQKYKSLATPRQRVDFALLQLIVLLNGWMTGKTLNEMQALLPPDSRKKRYSTGARKFVTKIVPSLSYLFGVPARVLPTLAPAEEEQSAEAPPSVAVLGRCVRCGFERAEKAALEQHLSSARLARRALHRRFGLIEPYLTSAKVGESWSLMLSRVESAMDRELNSRSWDLDDLT